MTGPASRFAWAESGPEQLEDGLFRIPLPLTGDPLRAVNAYLWQEEGGDLLVDCGWTEPSCFAALTQSLRRVGSGLDRVRLLFVTHVHGDHLGAADLIRQEGGAVVTLGLEERESAELWATDPGRSRERTRRRLASHGAKAVVQLLEEQARRAPRDDPLSPLPDLYIGQGRLRLRARDLEVVATPGHTRGHLCLFDAGTGTLFAGDHVLPQITPSIGVEAPLPGRPLADFLDSLARVRDLPARVVLPAHGPVFTDLAGRVDQLLEHHRSRLQLCLESVETGRQSAMAVAAAIPWTRRERRLSELDPFNQMLAVNETAAHLDLLAERGELQRRMSNSLVEYYTVSRGSEPPRREMSR
ncbi:MAG: MBL fold metallo-hydrolase [Candidatus Dormibacteria bacterium]